MSEDDKATDAKTPKASAAAAQPPAANTAAAAAARPFDDVKPGDEVGFASNKPLVAGETPRIMTAKVLSIDHETGECALNVGGETQVETVRASYSERREPGTWHRLPRA